MQDSQEAVGKVAAVGHGIESRHSPGRLRQNSQHGSLDGISGVGGIQSKTLQAASSDEGSPHQNRSRSGSPSLLRQATLLLLDMAWHSVLYPPSRALIILCDNQSLPNLSLEKLTCTCVW